ncbi:MAG: biotin--[acetyl-CoA-carboxylase] ligase, partial [Thermodesulfobacteriota bacterium]
MYTREVEIVRFLKEESGYLSGQAISRALGISRTAVWKQIGKLREAGYSIEARPRKGYRLTGPPPFNGIEVASSLETEFIGKGGNLLFFPMLDSTNSKAMELARAGAPEGTAIIADSQRAGKGRLGRRWESPPGLNLYTSIILRPKILPQDAQSLTLLSAVATAEAVAAYSPVKPTVKWPNDILIESCKVAGILTEMNSEMDRVNFVVVGIGVNLNAAPSLRHGRMRIPAVSIKGMEKTGSDVPRARFTQTLYSAMEKWYKVYLTDGLSPVVSAWRGYFASEGKPVRVSGPPNIEG